MKIKYRKLLIGALTAWTIGIAQVNVSLAEENPEAPAVHSENVSAFTKGVQAWANNCTRCHNLRNPNEFSDGDWEIIISHMRVRAGLTGEEARNILKFLQQSNY